MMKIIQIGAVVPFLAIACSTNKSISQTGNLPTEKSLLWEISGNGLEKPSYLFGTIHMLCRDDAVLSEDLKSAIQKTDRVYLELDMDNLFEMIGALRQMKMKNDTTLAQLLSQEDYKKVKAYIESRNSPFPFSVLETYKPMLASSTLMESGMACGSTVAMEQLIMREAKENRKRIEGLETMAYQMSIFDSIPYKVQAQELLKFISAQEGKTDAEKEFEEMVKAYKNEDLSRLEELINKSGDVLIQYQDLLLFNRNRNWVQKLKTIMPERPVTIAVGAGHLPGENGVIALLRKAGYTVTAVKKKSGNQKII